MLKKRVLVLAKYHHPEEFSGIVNFAREAGWAVQIVVTSREPLPARDDFDGVILVHTYRDKAMEDYVQKFNRTAVVTVGRYFWPGIKNVRVGQDVAECARRGAAYFLADGYENLAMVERPRCDEHEEFAVFRQMVEQSGQNFVRLRESELAEDLRKAPKPLAIMAYDDEWAVRIYRICEELHILVPEQIALLGCSNVKHLCDLNYVTLSSINSRIDECGYQAAQVLSELMQGNHVNETTLITPGEVVVRESTGIPPVKDLRVAEVVRVIVAGYSDPLNVEELAAKVGLSRWALDEAFKRTLQITASAFLQQCRLEEAVRLLKGSELKVNEIAERVGYQNHVSFLRAFKRVHHCSPSMFREKL